MKNIFFVIFLLNLDLTVFSYEVSIYTQSKTSHSIYLGVLKEIKDKIIES